ncbi:chloramphenicol phosphotransferase CPT family protein [Deinococcus marmoris]|uniref:Chloramphenicol 3-O phosphotransferase n=1 Tax=Deinococcus marmoris TaxID=249408 RepID=A0A1U7NSR5_9DEIO|nr:AAA family ATPase [Deinococcus marmoris]OLV15962.1 chloramphenicol 3-O phosphotransferase [Deinococcus marmoris]
MTPLPGHIILINGASSAGKTTLCRALRDALDIPFLHFSLDFFMFGADVLPRTPQGKVRDWPRIRPQVFGGFYRCLPALLEAGNNLVVDLIIENRAQRDHLRELLAPHDVYLVGLHCPVGELERREAARGDRQTGEARRDARTVHTFSAYDLEIDCGDALLHNVARVIGGWTARTAPHIWGSGPAGEAAAPRVSASGPVP